jgi:5-methylcytosine-specific restriction endonuclease McrA
MTMHQHGIIDPRTNNLNPSGVVAPWGMTETCKEASMFDILSQKQCTKCGETKPLSNFYYSKRKDWEGYKAACKACTLAERRETYRANPEKYKEKQRLYVAENLEQNRARARQWHLDNPGRAYERVKEWRENFPDKRRESDRKRRLQDVEKARAVDRARYKKNPEPFLRAIKKWFSNNPEKKKEIKHRRRAKEKGVLGGHFTEAQWLAVLDLYGHRCLACGASNVELERDHVIPLGPPHSDEITNIQPLCRSCNASKGNKAIDYR